MASQWPPKKNTAFTLFFTLYKNDGTVIANPGTYTKKVSIDGGTITDIAASVTEEDTTYGQLSVVLSSSEMNGDAIWVQIKDDTSGCVPFTTVLYTTGSLHDEMKADTAAILADTGTDGVVVGDFVAAALAKLGIVTSGTAQSASSTGLVLASSAAYADDELNGAIVVITGGTGVGQARFITDYVGSTDTATVDPAWTTTPSGTITYIVVGVPPAQSTTPAPVNVTQWSGTAVGTPDTAGYPKVTIKDGTGAGEIALTAGAVDTVTTTITATNLTNAPTSGDLTATMKASVTTAATASTPTAAAVTGNVGGNVTGTIGGLAAQAKADVNAELLDVLATDTQTPHTGAPAATTTILGMLKWLYLRARNKHTYTADTGTVFADDGSTPVATETHGDDATTLTKGKWS